MTTFERFLWAYGLAVLGMGGCWLAALSHRKRSTHGYAVGVVLAVGCILGMKWVIATP